MTDNELNCHVHSSAWSNEPLENGQPLEYEDKWGKELPPSYSLNLQRNFILNKDYYLDMKDGLVCEMKSHIIE